jgi:hypothetical protein
MVTALKRLSKQQMKLEKSGVFIHYKCNSGTRKLHPGHPSSLVAISNDLSQFVCETRAQRIQVSTRMVRHKAYSLLPTSMGKSINVDQSLLYKDNGPQSSCCDSHRKKYYQETTEESWHFIAMMKDKVADKDASDIINMDQTSILVSFHSTRL